MSEQLDLVDERLVRPDLDQPRLRRVVFEDCRLEEADSRVDISNARCARTEIRRCALNGVGGASSLKGVAMTWEDVVAGAGLWAAAVGITLLEEDE